MTEEENLGKVEIGEDKPQIEPKTVLVENWKVEPVVKDGKEIGKKVILVVNHPDVTDKSIEISGAKYEFDKKIKVSGIWWKLDSKKKIPYNSALANILRHYKITDLEGLKGEQIETTTDDQNYLVVKAY